MTWILVLALGFVFCCQSLTSCVILGKHFGSLGLSLLIYQIVGVRVGDDVDEVNGSHRLKASDAAGKYIKYLIRLNSVLPSAQSRRYYHPSPHR